MADSTQLLRQWTILRILSARRHGATLKELADETCVSQKTILRDLRLIQRLAFPVTETVGTHGRKHWTMESVDGLPGLTFTLEEAAALYLGRQFLEGLAGTMFWQGAQSASTKIRAALGEPALRHLQKLAVSFYLTSHALIDYQSRGTMIDDLMIAIEDRKLTVITYQSLRATEPVTLYDIHPYLPERLPVHVVFPTGRPLTQLPRQYPTANLAPLLHICVQPILAAWISKLWGKTTVDNLSSGRCLS